MAKKKFKQIDESQEKEGVAEKKVTNGYKKERDQVLDSALRPMLHFKNKL